VVDFAKAAVDYVAMGWPIFPLSRGMKIPAVGASKGGQGVKDATVDPGVIAKWGKEYPQANIGLACGVATGFIVVDLDPRNGANETMAELAKKGRAFPPCPTARTGGGGAHLLFRYDAKLINSKSKVGPGIDIKTTGGYIVASPSFVKQPSDSIGDGNYTWVTHPRDIAPPRMPIWLSTILTPPPKPDRSAFTPKTDAPKSIRSIVDFLTKSHAGDRNNRLYWASCRAAEVVRQRHVSEGSAVDQLLSAAVSIGLPHKEAIATIISAFRGGSDVDVK
jgi:hypothetical protein